MKKISVLMLSLLSICGCLGIHPVPTPEQINSADYGAPPRSYDGLVRNALAAELVRPDSLYVRQMDPPIQNWVVTPDGETIFGYGVCGFLVMGISKMEPFFVMIRNERVVYEHLGFDLAKTIPGKTWMTAGTNPYRTACPNLFR